VFSREGWSKSAPAMPPEQRLLLLLLLRLWLLLLLMFFFCALLQRSLQRSPFGSEHSRQ
jgi:hypothetical protein